MKRSKKTERERKEQKNDRNERKKTKKIRGARQKIKINERNKSLSILPIAINNSI
jgi:hypothetical protein